MSNIMINKAFEHQSGYIAPDFGDVLFSFPYAPPPISALSFEHDESYTTPIYTGVSFGAASPPSGDVIASGDLISVVQSVSVVRSGDLVGITQSVFILAEGDINTITQIVGRITSGNLTQLEQAVDLRLTGKGGLVSLGQTVNNTVSGNLANIVQRVRAVPTISEVQREYTLEVVIGAVVVPENNLCDVISVTREENSAALASITIQPLNGMQSLEFYHGKDVQINVVYADRAVRLFTGTVDIPEYDLIGQRITLRCTDKRTELNNTLPRSLVNSIGVYNVDIFGELKDQAKELDDRLSTTPFALDYDANGNPTFTAWQPKTNPDFTLQDCDTYLRQPSVEVASRGRIVNDIKIEFQHRYPRLRKQIERYSWSHPIAAGVCAWYLAGSPRLVTKAAAYSAFGLTWVPSLYEARDIPRNGFYRCCAGIDPIGGGQSCGYVAFTTLSCTSTTQTVRDGFGNVVNDSEGNAKTTTKLNCRDTGLNYAGSVTATKEKRYAQTVTENLNLNFSAPASINQFGAVTQEFRYGFESPVDFDAWEDDNIRSPNITGGNKDSVFINDYLRSIQTVQAIARNRILGSHRATRVTFQTQFRPEIDLRHTVEVDTRKVKSKGKVQLITHRYDCTDKVADTEVITVHSRSLYPVTNTPMTPPTRPSNAYSERTVSVNVPFKRDRIAVSEPPVPEEDRNPVELNGGDTNYVLNVPNDLLEVYFDDYA